MQSVIESHQLDIIAIFFQGLLLNFENKILGQIELTGLARR